jgi:hypothetical protein
VTATLATLQAGSFAGVASNGTVLLGWTTLSEADTAYYTVNRLTAGNWANVVPYVPALDSASGGVYSATDTTLSGAGAYEYQLEAVQLDGTTEVLATCTVVVNAPITVTIRLEGGNIRLTWTVGTPPYHVQKAAALVPAVGAVPAVVVPPPTSVWVEVPLTDSTTNTVVLPAADPADFFRVYNTQP